MCDETTTESKTIPITPEEKAIQDALINNILPIYMKDQGYDFTPKTEQVYKNPGLVTSLQDQAKQIQDQINALPPGSKEGTNLQNQLNKVNNQLNSETSQVTTKISYDVKLNPYGEELQAQKEKALDYQTTVTEKYMSNVMDFLDGKFTISDDQKKFIQDLYSPIKDTAFQLLDEVKASYEKTGADMNAELAKYKDEIDKTGVSIGAALNAVNDQIENTKSGILAGVGEEEKKIADMGQSVKAALMTVGTTIQKGGDDAKQALEQLYAIKKVMIDKKIENLYTAQQKSVAAKAATLGRSPMDPQFQLEFLNNMTSQIEMTNLTLAEQEATAKVGLIMDTSGKMVSLAYQGAALEGQLGEYNLQAAKEKTAAAEQAGLAKQQLGMAKAAVEESQGAKKEEAAKTGMAIAERTGAGAESVASQKASVGTTVEQAKAGMGEKLAVGLPVSQIGIGMDVASLQNAITQQAIQNKAGMLSAPMGVAGLLSAEAMAQPTTTTTKQGSALGSALGVVGGLGSVAASVMGGVGAMQSAGSLASMLSNANKGQAQIF